VLVGEGAERDALGKLAQSLGLQERVVFAGRRPHTPSLHWLFDISVLSSRGEGFPNSIVEAMAAGRPIVATRVGGVPDAVTDGVSGLLVAPGSPEELAGALARILEDGALGARLAAAARDSARQRFAAGAVIPRLEAAYGSLIERARRGRRSR
jgi:glycosyltransferase involved in cell wall biosynthesis